MLPAFAPATSDQQILNVVATAANGQVVVDLKVLDNGKARRVTSLKLPNGAAAPTAILIDLRNTESSAWSAVRTEIPAAMCRRARDTWRSDAFSAAR